MKTFLILLVSLFVSRSLAMEVIGREKYGDGSEVTMIAPLGILPSGGFFPLRVEMKNVSTKDLEWTFRCDSRPADYNEYAGQLSSGELDRMFASNFSVSCPRGEERVVELLIPIHQRIDPWSWRRQIHFILEKEGGSGSFWTFDGEPVLEVHFGMSAELLSRFERELLSNWSNRSNYYSRVGDYLAGAVKVELLPEDWRAYSGYDALVLSREDYLALGVSVKSGIEKWVHSGGHLIVLNGGQKEELPGFQEEMISQGFGLKSLVECGKSYDNLDVGQLKRVMLRGPGPKVVSASSNYSVQAWGLGTELGERMLGTNWLLVALAAFAIIVGPVNLFVLANKHRRHRLFVTTPVISLVAGLLLVGFIVMKDGFGGEGARAIAIDVGGPDNKFASVFQEQFVRTGILLDSDFSFETDAVFSAVPAPATDFNRSGSATSLGLFQGQFQKESDRWNLKGNFFKSRTEQAQILTAVRPSRERLELLSSLNGAPTVVSSFSFPLKEVYIRGKGNEIWSTSSIAPGETVTLTKASQSAQLESLMPTITRFGSSRHQGLERLIFRPGSFSALGESAPALETHTAIDWKETPVLVTGRLIK